MGQAKKRVKKGRESLVKSEEQSSKDTNLTVVHSNPERFKHLEGMDEDQKNVIRLMASIFVNAVIDQIESNP